MGTRAEQKARTRAALKTAAMRLVEEQGADDLSVTEITRAAGVAGGTFYVHFESKDALLQELVGDLNVRMVHELREVFSRPARGPKEQLDRLARAYLEFWFRHRGQVGIYMAHLAEAGAGEILTRGTQPELHQGLVMAFVAAGDVDAARARVAATTIFATWRAAAFTTVSDEEVTADIAAPLLCAATWGVLTALNARLPTRLLHQLKSLSSTGIPA